MKYEGNKEEKLINSVEKDNKKESEIDKTEKNEGKEVVEHIENLKQLIH